jgi:hypothetical protein
MSRGTHHATASRLEDRAGELLEVGGDSRALTGKQITEAQALATLALSHRTAAHTEAVQRGQR